MVILAFLPLKTIHPIEVCHIMVEGGVHLESEAVATIKVRKIHIINTTMPIKDIRHTPTAEIEIIGNTIGIITMKIDLPHIHTIVFLPLDTIIYVTNGGIIHIRVEMMIVTSYLLLTTIIPILININIGGFLRKTHGYQRGPAPKETLVGGGRTQRKKSKNIIGQGIFNRIQVTLTK